MRLLAVLAVAFAVGSAVFAIVTDEWGTRGEPDVSVPNDPSAFGYSYTTDINPPWWAYPVTAAAAVAAGATTWRLTRRFRGDQPASP